MAPATILTVGYGQKCRICYLKAAVGNYFLGKQPSSVVCHKEGEGVFSVSLLGIAQGVHSCCHGNNIVKGGQTSENTVLG